MDKISPYYQMKLVQTINEKLFEQFKSYNDVEHYIRKWYECDEYGNWENFHIATKKNKENQDKIDATSTLHSMGGELLLRIAVDLGIETPDFIPSIPTFKNELKSSYETASQTFEKAYNNVETDPDLAIALSYSALESVCKEILNDPRVEIPYDKTMTLPKLINAICKGFKLIDTNLPVELKTIGSSLINIAKAIEDIRSDKTKAHGKTDSDYRVQDSLYTKFVVNSVASIGLFLLNFYKEKYPTQIVQPQNSWMDANELPF